MEDDSDDDDEDDAATLLHGWHSQKAAPLVVRVIDDRENMRARKKGPPSWPPCSYAESCQEDETPRANVRRAVPVVAANGLPERALLRINRFKEDSASTVIGFKLLFVVYSQIYGLNKFIILYMLPEKCVIVPIYRLLRRILLRPR